MSVNKCPAQGNWTDIHSPNYDHRCLKEHKFLQVVFRLILWHCKVSLWLTLSRRSSRDTKKRKTKRKEATTWWIRTTWCSTVKDDFKAGDLKLKGWRHVWIWIAEYRYSLWLVVAKINRINGRCWWRQLTRIRRIKIQANYPSSVIWPFLWHSMGHV